MKLGISATRVALCAIVAQAIVAIPVAAQATPPKSDAKAATHKPVAKPASSANKETADSLASVALQRAEENKYAADLMTLRTRLLARSSWASLGDRCNPGALRVFNADTSTKAQTDLQLLLDRMEEIVTLYGVGASVDDKDGRDLVRGIMEWEAGISRPRWDSKDTVSRRAVAAGLTGEYPDPKGPGCLAAPRGSDTVTFVLPGLTDVKLTSTPSTKIKAYFGAQGMQHARDEFYRAYGGDTSSALEVIQIAPVVRWRGWAVVGVKRPVSQQGVRLDGPGKGGASYLMRRVGTEWRLVAITRSWGG